MASVPVSVPLPILHPSAKTTLPVFIKDEMINLPQLAKNLATRLGWIAAIIPVGIKDDPLDDFGTPVSFDGVINLASLQGAIVRLANPEESWATFKANTFDSSSTEPVSSVLPSFDTDDLNLTLCKKKSGYDSH